MNLGEKTEVTAMGAMDPEPEGTGYDSDNDLVVRDPTTGRAVFLQTAMDEDDGRGSGKGKGKRSIQEVLPQEIDDLYRQKQIAEQIPSAEQLAAQRDKSNHLPPLVKQILAPIWDNVAGYNLKLSLNTRAGRMESKLVNEATETARNVMEQHERDRDSQEAAIHAGLIAAARNNVILSRRDLISGKTPVDAVFTADGIHPNELSLIRGSRAPLKTQRVGMDTDTAYKWAIDYLNDQHNTDDFRELSPKNQLLVMKAISPEAILRTERKARGPGVVYHYTQDTGIRPEFKPEYQEKYAQLQQIDESPAAVMPDAYVTGGAPVIVETLKLFYQVRTDMHILDLLTTSWLFQELREDEEGAGSVDFGSTRYLEVLGPEVVQDCQDVITNYLEASLKKVLVPSGLGWVPADVVLAGKDRDGFFYHQLAEGEPVTGYRLRRDHLGIPDRGPLITRGTAPSTHQGTQFLDLQYQRYIPPTGEKLDVRTYRNFSEIMMSDTIDPTTPPDGNMIARYQAACTETVTLYNKLSAIVEAFPQQFSLGLNELRINLEKMFGGDPETVAQYRVWALFVMLGIVINIQYAVGLIVKYEIQYGRDQFATLVYRNKGGEFEQAFKRFLRRQGRGARPRPAPPGPAPPGIGPPQ